MARSKPATIIASLFFAGLVFDTVTPPQIIGELRAMEDNSAVRAAIFEYYNARRNRYLGPVKFSGANLHFHGSATVGLKTRSLLGEHVFSRAYDSNTGKTLSNRVYFIPNLWLIGIALLIGCALYFGISRAYPATKPPD